ncbi:MAG: 50S ribosomal protein L15 [Bacteroidetes bacterium]|nr:50S ribosomal protein L15 [Bacteroidota bacterium]MBL6962541.1 50S ribosomal protein L15 [Bacteroidota bacterium]
MDLSNLKPAEGSTHRQSKRLGRGEGSKKGGTSGRGHKGAKSRSGYSKKIGHEGGQMPLQRRVPKFGFTNPNRVEYVPVNLDVLQKLSETHKIEKFNPEVFKKHGLLSNKELVKVLGRGELKAKLEVTAHAFSKSAIEAIEKNGGHTIKL